jgi:flagellar basal-body rod protein FlgF
MEMLNYIALSRQMAVNRQMEVVANNLANMNTTAFRGENILFEEYLQGSGSRKSSFVQDYGMLRDLREGELKPTGSPLDFAVSGKGFFTVETPDGQRFTRNGQFRLDAEGKLTSNEGFPILDENGRPIVIDAREGTPQVAKDGTINTPRGGKVARISLVSFDNEMSMRKTEGSLYATDEEAKPSADGKMIQGMIENSNVVPIVEMTRMIELSRSYQSSQKLMQDDHERLRKAIDRLTKTV